MFMQISQIDMTLNLCQFDYDLYFTRAQARTGRKDRVQPSGLLTVEAGDELPQSPFAEDAGKCSAGNNMGADIVESDRCLW
jgi:hypothetical protein